ncbi:MAG TPA: TonB-dependent receptor, partial [Hyphomonadaceae bacterium]|nr:TonB-dependent receptor [Hyphomonadaceae bacterium]
FNGGCFDNFSAGDCTPSQRAAIDSFTVEVHRLDQTSLASWDFKLSRPDFFHIWAGDVGAAFGVEARHEDYTDNRDPRQDGSINFQDIINTTLVTNDLQGNSGSLDTHGDRDVESAYAEFRVPLVSPEMNIPMVQSIDAQVAARYENFDTFGSVTKPKIALSWRPLDFLLLRSSWSQGFRAPNLQQQFESGLQRSNTRTDFIRCEAAKRQNSAVVFTTSCPSVASATQSVISNRQGSTSLKPEDSDNLSAGFVLESTFLPEDFGRITFTADWWRIRQTDVVGIFGDDNHILLDYVLRVNGSTTGDPAVHRAAPDAQDTADFAGTGLAPVGDILFVDDNYINLDRREARGVDLGLYYDLKDTPLGDWNFRVNGAFLDKFFQEVSADGAIINAAVAAGKIPAQLTVAGQGNLVRNFGRPKWRYTAALTWRKDNFGAGWFTTYVGDVEDPNIVLTATGQRWVIDSFQTHNLYVQYELGDRDQKPLRIRLGMRNIFNEVPPLADTNFGYLGDIDNPAGRFMYVNLRKEF